MALPTSIWYCWICSGEHSILLSKPLVVGELSSQLKGIKWIRLSRRMKRLSSTLTSIVEISTEVTIPLGSPVPACPRSTATTLLDSTGLICETAYSLKQVACKYVSTHARHCSEEACKCTLDNPT